MFEPHFCLCKFPGRSSKTKSPPPPLRILAQKLFLLDLGGRDNKKDPAWEYIHTIYLKPPIKDPTTTHGMFIIPPLLSKIPGRWMKSHNTFVTVKLIMSLREVQNMNHRTGPETFCESHCQLIPSYLVWDGFDHRSLQARSCYAAPRPGASVRLCYQCDARLARCCG